MDKLDVKCNDVKNEKVILLKCGHCFHGRCLKVWYKGVPKKIVQYEKLSKNYYVFKEI